MPHTLLLADDSVTIQRVIELTFADEDVKVVAVSDGDQAIARLESSPPDIVLADIGMPGKNGYEVAKYIKQSPNLSHIPVVLLTGAFEPVDQARAAEAGCDGVLAKPFEPQLVISRVKELLAKSHPIPESLDDNLAPPTPDRWTAPAVDQAFAPTPAAPAASAPLDDYFDRLDAAFQTLSGPGGSGMPAAPNPAPAPEPVADIDWFGSNPDASTPATEPWDLPVDPSSSAAAFETAAPDAGATSAEVPDLQLSYDSPQSAFEALAEPETVEAPEPPPQPRWGEPPAASADQPAATERAIPEPPPVLAAAPPILSPGSPEPPRITALPSLADAFSAMLAAEQGEPMPSAIPLWPAGGPSTDELVEQISRRVLDRLSDRIVRDTVAEQVSQIAERLVREEIERIKASIK